MSSSQIDTYRVVGNRNEYPISADIFTEYRESNYTYIDKSLLCVDFMNDTSKAILIPRPRRFGKSTNLSMLNSFFSLPRPGENMDQRESLFMDLLIHEQREFWDKHFAKYPVICLSLKDLGETSWDVMLSLIKAKIVDLYLEFEYLESSLSPQARIMFNSVLSGQADIGALILSLKRLSQILEQYYHKKCIVLIDEYDWPMDHSLKQGFYADASPFFRDMFSSLIKGNPHVLKTLFVGVLRIGESGFLSGLNNLTVYPIHRKPKPRKLLTLYEDKFGFTEQETMEILCRSNRTGDLRSVTEWYKGYLTGSGAHIYNPISIIRFMENEVIEPYWIQTGSSATLRQYLWNSTTTFKRLVFQLLEGFPCDSEDAGPGVEVTILDNLTYSEIACGSGGRRDQALFTLLFYAGYLTTNIDGLLVIPNKEIYNEWKSWILEYILDRSGPETLSLLTSLTNGDIVEFCDEFPELFIPSVSFHDAGLGEYEVVYHMFVLATCVFFKSEGYQVALNLESGRGRSDVLVIPRLPQHETMLKIEFKSIKPQKSEPSTEEILSELEEGVNVARVQNDRKNHLSQASLHTKIALEVVVAFWMKECHVGIHKRIRNDSGKWQSVQIECTTTVD